MQIDLSLIALHKLLCDARCSLSPRNGESILLFAFENIYCHTHLRSLGGHSSQGILRYLLLHVTHFCPFF